MGERGDEGEEGVSLLRRMSQDNFLFYLHSHTCLFIQTLVFSSLHTLTPDEKEQRKKKKKIRKAFNKNP